MNNQSRGNREESFGSLLTPLSMARRHGKRSGELPRLVQPPDSSEPAVVTSSDPVQNVLSPASAERAFYWMLLWMLLRGGRLHLTGGHTAALRAWVSTIEGIVNGL